VKDGNGTENGIGRNVLNFCSPRTLPGHHWLFGCGSLGTAGLLSRITRLLSRRDSRRFQRSAAGGGCRIGLTSTDCRQDSTVNIVKRAKAIRVFVFRSAPQQRTPPGHENNDVVDPSGPTEANGTRQLDLLPPTHGCDAKGLCFEAVVFFVRVAVFEKDANDFRPVFQRESLWGLLDISIMPQRDSQGY
jgi:hypothetical protein